MSVHDHHPHDDDDDDDDDHHQGAIMNPTFSLPLRMVGAITLIAITSANSGVETS